MNVIFFLVIKKKWKFILKPETVAFLELISFQEKQWNKSGNKGGIKTCNVSFYMVDSLRDFGKTVN